MARISLPDTSVLDIATIQTLINAINRHDDVLTQLTYTYSGTPKSDTADQSTTSTVFSTVFNPLLHEIQVGRKYASSSITTTAQSTTDANELSITFERPFRYPPIVFAIPRTNYDMLVTIDNKTETGFNAVVRSLDGTSRAGWIEWVAIGTRL